MLIPVAEVIRLSYPLSFLAGLISFLSPCVFPLVPVYAGYLGGRAGEVVFDRPPPAMLAAGAASGEAVLHRGANARATPLRAPVLANGVAFVLGFTTVFITVFYVLTAFDVAFFASHRRTVNLVAGSLVLVLGLQTLGLLRIGALMRERRRLVAPDRVGLVPAFLLGLSFAAGWTPCIGPQLTAILRVAQQGDFAGLPVMLTYSLGLALPFLVLAVLADRLQGAIRAINRHLGVINLVAGALLLVFGVLLLADSFTVFNRWIPTSPFQL